MEEDKESTIAAKEESTTVSFLEETRIIPPFPSMSERYYKHKLYKNDLSTDDSSQDLLVLAHSNRITIITLAPSHEILTLKKNVLKVDFGSEKVNRLENKVKGKWKKGAQKVHSESILGTVECTDGSLYKIRACMTGKIVEINKRLMEEPSLLTRKPWSDGFVAIILPPFQSKEVSNLEDYKR